MSRIVVGVDGSPASEGALRWAHEYASTVGASLEVIMSWNEHPLLASISETIGGGVPLDQVEAQANALLEATISAAIPEGSTVELTSKTASGAPAEMLVEAAQFAALLVVGRADKTGLGVFQIGSVATHCVRHASCPTVVVPE